MREEQHIAGEPQTWFRVSRWEEIPEPVQVLKETEQTITVLRWGRPYRQKKRGADETYYPTESEAVGVLVKRAQARVERARAEFARVQAAAEVMRRRYPDAPEWADTPAPDQEQS